MGLDFMRNYGGCRVEREVRMDSFWGEPQEGEGNEHDGAPVLNIEASPEHWQAINPLMPARWRAHDWAERPVRFIDGKDEGYTVAWLRGLGGYYVPVRLSEIGSVAMLVEDGVCRRKFATVERVVSMVTSAFPWEEIEGFAVALQKQQLRLLPASPPSEGLVNDFEKMSRAARSRSNDEMSVLEEMAVAQDSETPTVVDGRLESHAGGLDPTRSPVFGVIKGHRRNYLHSLGQQLLYQLEPGQRTPAFSLPPNISPKKEDRRVRFPVVSWYVRLSGGDGSTPNLGLVRIEASLRWFEARGYGSADGSDSVTASGIEFINRLSRTVFEYRCRESSYRRIAVSLHPIVRAEESLGALFCPHSVLRNNFYRLTGL